MNNLKYFRKKYGKTQKDIADLLGMTQTAYGNYELGKRTISPENLSTLADYYGISVDELMGRIPLEDYGKHLEEIPELQPEDEVYLPLVASLRCGNGTAGEPFSYIKKIPIPNSYIRRWGNDLKCITAIGESMSPTIIPGDILICKPGEEWTNGNVVSVNLNDCDMIKRIYMTSNGEIDLRSDNPAFETIHVTSKDQFTVLGRVMIPIPKEL